MARGARALLLLLVVMCLLWLGDAVSSLPRSRFRRGNRAGFIPYIGNSNGFKWFDGYNDMAINTDTNPIYSIRVYYTSNTKVNGIQVAYNGGLTSPWYGIQSGTWVEWIPLSNNKIIGIDFWWAGSNTYIAGIRFVSVNLATGVISTSSTYGLNQGGNSAAIRIQTYDQYPLAFFSGVAEYTGAMVSLVPYFQTPSWATQLNASRWFPEIPYTTYDQKSEERSDANLLAHDVDSDAGKLTYINIRTVEQAKINGLQFGYGAASGEWHGCCPGDAGTTLYLGDGEFITKVKVYFDQYVTGITFTLSVRGDLSYGLLTGNSEEVTGPIVGLQSQKWTSDSSGKTVRLSFIRGPPKEILYSSFEFDPVQGALQPRSLQKLLLENNHDEKQTMTAEYTYETATSISTTIEDSWTEGTSVTVEFEATLPFGMTTKVAVTHSWEVSHLESNTQTQEQRSSVTASTAFEVGPGTKVEGDVMVYVGSNQYMPFKAHRYAQVTTPTSSAITKIDRGLVYGYLIVDTVSEAHVSWGAAQPIS